MKDKNDDFPEQRLTPEEQALEEALPTDRPPLDPALRKKIEAAQARSLKKHGGSRKGSGRPALGKKKKLLSLSPEVIAALEQIAEAQHSGNTSAAAEAAVIAYAGKIIPKSKPARKKRDGKRFNTP